MKTLFKLGLLVAGIVLFTANSAFSQYKVRNNTDCKFVVKISYGDANTCESQGSVVVSLYPTSFECFDIPAGTEIIAAKGSYDPLITCPFYVGNGCFYLDSDDVSCTEECGNYKAILTLPYGVVINPN